MLRTYLYKDEPIIVVVTAVMAARLAPCVSPKLSCPGCSVRSASNASSDGARLVTSDVADDLVEASDKDPCVWYLLLLVTTAVPAGVTAGAKSDCTLRRRVGPAGVCFELRLERIVALERALCSWSAAVVGVFDPVPAAGDVAELTSRMRFAGIGVEGGGGADWNMGGWERLGTGPGGGGVRGGGGTLMVGFGRD